MADSLRDRLLWEAEHCVMALADSGYPFYPLDYSFEIDGHMNSVLIRQPGRLPPSLDKLLEDNLMEAVKRCPAIENIALFASAQRQGFLNALLRCLALSGRYDYVVLSNVGNGSLAEHFDNKTREPNSAWQRLGDPSYSSRDRLFPSFALDLVCLRETR